MNRFLKILRVTVAWIWRHTSAGVAVVLIGLALVMGYHLGQDSPEASTEIAANAHDDQTDDTASEPQMYTCSMHPSVRLPDPDAKCPICFMELIPVTADVGEDHDRRVTISKSAAALSRIETAQVGRFFPTASTRLYGKMTFDETAVARLTAYFPGRIERLFVNYLGVSVSKGDHMAEVYSPELLAAFEELRQSIAADQNTRGTSEIVRSTTRDMLAAAREKLRLFGITPEQIAEIENGSFDSDLLTIFAPIGGVVTHLAVREGDYVQTGAAIATVADLSRLWLDMEAYESQLPLLRWGQPVTFTVESHPGETFEGQISFIEPMVDERTRTAAVRVAVDNADRRLKPGMYVSAVVRTRIADHGAVVNDELAGRWVGPMHPSELQDGPGACKICGMDLVPTESLGVVGDSSEVEMPLVIPRTAVLFTGTRSVVYVEVPDSEQPTYEGREVVLGPRADDFYVVREGLREGESVVVDGAFRIDSAMQIVAKPSMMTPAGGGGGNAHAGHTGMAPGAMPTETSASVPEAFMAALKPVYAAYLDAQESLAGDDVGGFVQAADDLQAALENVKEVGLVGEPRGEWRRAAAKLRTETAVTTPEQARVLFERMSKGIIALERAFGHSTDETWHVAYCPMAFDNAGAEWMQRGDKVNNPYFGSRMLRCGDIRAAFPPTGTAADAVSDMPDMPGMEHDHE
ncbi:MAG: efflux RND transporter periplasmic adaptor subunit [Planctomycetota bacterium]|nr:efflux RND transporter periplasmic adaptor subunit [Planctomycetota bacterium]